MKLVLLLAAGALAAASASSAVTTARAKEAARARLTAALPLRAAPAKTIRVGWRVDVPDGRGGLQPFGATGMFVRLLSRTGAPATTGLAPRTMGSDGRYAANVRVPRGGIGGIRVGLRGTTDITFPLENDPFMSKGGARCDVAALRATLTAFVRAYQGGDLRRLDGLFSRERFHWYAVGGPGTRQLPDARDRGTLLPYFRERHRQNDRLVLSGFRFNSFERGRALGHFELRGRRRADDFREGQWFGMSGKGALDCARFPVRIGAMFVGGPAG